MKVKKSKLVLVGAALQLFTLKTLKTVNLKDVTNTIKSALYKICKTLYCYGIDETNTYKKLNFTYNQEE